MTQNMLIIEAKGPNDAEYGRIGFVTFNPAATVRKIGANGRIEHTRKSAEESAQRSVSAWYASDQFPDHHIRYREV
jgi:hypothetical protein